MQRRSLTVSLLVVVLSCLPSEGRADSLSEFESGRKLFAEAVQYRKDHPSQRGEVSRRFRSAAAAFVSAWSEGAATTEVFTNAANSFYFAGDMGEAVLFYRRAVAVEPGNAAARSALEHIREGLPIHRKKSGVTSLSDSLFFWHDERFLLARIWCFYVFFPTAWMLFAVELARRRWRWIHALLVLVAPFALFALLLSYLFRLRRPYATVGALCLLPALASLASLAIDAAEGRSGRHAVVLVEVRGRNGDGESYSPSHTRPFPPGTEVEVVERRSGGSGGDSKWLRVELRDGSLSFLPAGTVEWVVSDPPGASR